MLNKIKIVVGTLVVGALLVLSFGTGCALDNRVQSDSVQDMDVVEQAWSIIFRNYVEKDELDAGTLSQAAIKGMVEALDDPYTVYLDTETYQLSLGDLEGKFEGIGAHVAVKDGQLIIIAPIPGSPAAKAGIRAGDIVLEVDGQSTSGMTLTEAVLNIRGAKGTSVSLLILHQDETEPEEVEIVRAEIDLSSVYFEMRENIAYVNITHFSKRTNEELSPVLESVIQKGATGIVLDLRSNPGGVLQVVLDVAGCFLEKGVVVNMFDNQGRHTALMAEPDGVVTDLPMVVLVDNYSASASEVLVGALQDYGRATIAGTKTFGKGSVNALYQLKDGSGLYLTTARLRTPDGRPIEGDGLYPDYELELTGEDEIQWAIDYLKGNN